MPCVARARARHNRLERYIEGELAGQVDHLDFIAEPRPQTELVLTGRSTVPPALEYALALAELSIVPDASGTQGDDLVLVVR